MTTASNARAEPLIAKVEMATLPIPPEEHRLWVEPFHDEDVFLRSGRETVGLLESVVARKSG